MFEYSEGGLKVRQKRRRLTFIFNVAVTYVGTIIGAGFASGQEILVFFTRYGITSYISMILAGLIFMYMGSKILILGRELKANSYGDMIEDVFGRLSPFINIYLFIAYMIISVAMFAGAGALFGDHQKIGVAITAALAAIIIIRGVEGLIHANTFIIPLLLIFNVIVFIYNIYTPINTTPYAENSAPMVFNSIKSSIMYISYNVILCIGVLVPLGNSIKDISTAKWGGYMGGALIGIMLIMSNYCLLRHMPRAGLYEMPLLYIANTISPLFGKLYTFILWGAIFTTLIANLFSITSAIESRLPSYLHGISIFIAVIVLALLSALGFSNIISVMYPILGVIGCIFLIYIAIYPLDSKT